MGLACADDDDQARAGLGALDAAIQAYDGPLYHREGRRFHLALIRPCRLLHMLDAAWCMTEPLQPESRLGAAVRAVLRADHARMSGAFCARSGRTDRRVRRLRAAIGALPQGAGLVAPDHRQ